MAHGRFRRHYTSGGLCVSMATPRDLLPPWLLVDHDGASEAAPPSHVHLIPWTDGFIPTGCSGRLAQMVADQPRSTPHAVRVVDAAVAPLTADLLYASAVRATVWGVFVPTRELLGLQQPLSEDELRQRREALAAQEEAAMDKQQKAQYRQALAALAVEEFLVARGCQTISIDDWKTTHGVAVWVIASDCDDETEYHLDYAEMLRYETNVIFPPIYGATLHVSPLKNEGASSEDDAVERVGGGGFHVNTRGLEHYREYGYKTRLASTAKKLTTDDMEARMVDEPGWRSVAYCYRRGIICDGEFPHFSGRVRALPAGKKRVVVGFNLFPHEIGAFVERFPEHSDAFNRYVKLSQTAAKQSWTLESVKKNPKQAAFLKFLARKVKESRAREASETRGAHAS